MKSIKEFSEHLYRQHGTEGVGVSFYKKYEKEILTYDPVDFLVCQFCHYPVSHIMDMMFCLSSLWKNLLMEDWKKIMIKIGYKPQNFKPMDDTGYFGEIRFLCRYLEIDAIQLYLSIPEIAIASKVVLLKYVKMHAIFLLKDSWDKESFEEIYPSIENKLAEVKTKLLTNSVVKEFKYDENVLRDYIKEQITVFYDSNQAEIKEFSTFTHAWYKNETSDKEELYIWVLDYLPVNHKEEEANEYIHKKVLEMTGIKRQEQHPERNKDFDDRFLFFINGPLNKEEKFFYFKSYPFWKSPGHTDSNPDFADPGFKKIAWK